MKPLPKPTPEQQHNFANHVAWAHSWYKHLPLLTGGEFMIFLAADAGEGFSAESPRLHNGWHTTEEYRSQFGYLDYAWRISPDEPFARDTVKLIPYTTNHSSLTLYPFVSTDFNAQETLYLLEKDVIQALQAGQAHLFRPNILDWADAYRRYENSWYDLANEERQIVSDMETEAYDQRPQHSIPAKIRQHLETELRSHLAYTVLCETQYQTLRKAIDQLLY